MFLVPVAKAEAARRSPVACQFACRRRLLHVPKRSADLVSIGRWASEAALKHYIQGATAQQLLLRMPSSAMKRLKHLLHRGFEALRVPDALTVGLPTQHLLKVALSVPEGVVAACYSYGILESSFPSGHCQGRSAERREVPGRTRGTPCQGAKSYKHDDRFRQFARVATEIQTGEKAAASCCCGSDRCGRLCAGA